MKKNKFYITLTLMLSLICTGVLTSCDPIIEPGQVPAMVFPSDSLVVNLNELTHPPFICVVNSETGLKSIDLYVLKDGAQKEKLDKSITNFYNPHNHSINIKPVYTDDMRAIIVEATDLAGQVTTYEFKLTIIPLYGLPELHFSDGTNEIKVIEYVEGDESPDVFVEINSIEKINYLIFYQEKGLNTKIINDTVKFYAGETKTKVNLKTYGDGYEFERGLTALKAIVVVGERNKSNEAILKVNFRAAIKVHLDQAEDAFNGLEVNAQIPFSGHLEAPRPVQSLTYKLFDRKGVVIGAEENISFGADKTFSGSFTAYPNLGSVVFTAITVEGKIDETIIPVHVGYRLIHLMASLSGSSEVNIYTSPGCFFSAEKERIFDYCGGRDNSDFVDVGFSIWSNVNIRVQRIDYDNKFRTTTTCSPNNYGTTSVRDWPTRNDYDVSMSTISYADFHTSSITDIENETVGDNVTSGVYFANAFPSSPTGQTVPIYQTKINGEWKKVIMAFDKTESVDNTTPIYSTFWFYAKIQL